MLHPLLKNALWLILLTTYTFATFRFTLLEVAHRVAHLGDGAGHHHFHNHDTQTEHFHVDLTDLADLFEQPDDSELPTTQRDLNLKQPQFIAVSAPALTFGQVIATANFPTYRRLLSFIYLKVESPPPDAIPA